MPANQILVAQAYTAFNRRDIDAALALMSDSISWPKASEGGRVVGKEEIRAYWTRQWDAFDPHVEPLEVIEAPDATANVKVHQMVRSLAGELLSDSEVCARLHHLQWPHRTHGPEADRRGCRIVSISGVLAPLTP